MEERDAKKDGADSSDACPHGVGGADGDSLDRFGKQQHAGGQAGKESRSPKIVFESGESFHFSKAKSESGLETAGDNQDNPVHSVFFVISGAKLTVFRDISLFI